MDYEKNNEALDIVKRMVADGQVSQEVAEKYFPELKESEDEKIRKDIIRFIKGCFPDETSEQRKTYLAWLEKQKEFVSADFDDVWETAGCEELTAPLEKYSKEAIKKMCHAWYDKGIELERRKWLEKQGEQKSTNSKEDDVRRVSTIQVLEYAKSLPDYNQFGKDAINKNIAWLEKQSEQKQELLTKEKALNNSPFVEQKPVDLVAILKDYFANTPKEQREKDLAELKHLNNVGFDVEIAFGAKDSDLQEETYFIPKGFHAEIDGDKVHIK